MNQKSVKNGTKNSLKKLIFTTFRPTHFESFFRKFEVIAFLFSKLSTDSEKIVHFSRKGCRLLTCLPDTVKASHCPFYCLISRREAGCEFKLFSSFGLTRPVIEPKSSVSAADALFTRLVIKKDKIGKTNSIVICRMLSYILLIKFSKSSNKCNFCIARKTENETHSTSFPSENSYYIVLDYECSAF